MAVHTRNRACWKCGKRGHKACKCGKVRVESGSIKVEEKPPRSCHKLRHRMESGSQIEEKGRKGERATTRAGGHEATATAVSMSLAASASSPLAEPHMASWEAHDKTSDAANLNTTCDRPTRPENELHNSPKGLLSMLLEGGSWTGASNKLGVETSMSLCLYSIPFTFYIPDCLTVIPSLQLLRPVSVYTGPCRAHLDYLVYIVSTLPLHFLSVPSAPGQSFRCQKCPVRHDSLRPGT